MKNAKDRVTVHTHTHTHTSYDLKEKLGNIGTHRTYMLF